MTDDLRSLYQEVILDHYKSPRNFRQMEEANSQAEGYNPLCGDQITLYLQLDENGVVRDITFQGAGCAISTASASLMTEAVKGRTRQEAKALLRRFQQMVTAEGGLGGAESSELGKLEVLSGVRDYPVRIKCATLAWHALKAALDNSEDPVTTE